MSNAKTLLSSGSRKPSGNHSPGSGLGRPNMNGFIYFFWCFLNLGLNLWFIKSKDYHFYHAGRNAIISACLLTFLAGISLVYALYTSDLSLIYVNKYSSIFTPTIYKIGGFWAGMEGSLLFWVFILSIYTVLLI